MHVLHRAVGGRVQRRQAEIVAHAPIPRLRQVGGVEPAGNQLLLDLEAQDDMQRIGHLVGIDADQPALDMQDVTEDVVLRPAFSQMPLDDRQRPAPEGGIAPDLLFHEQALALVHSHATGIAERPVRPFRRQVLLVERVAGLVQHAHQRRQELVGAVARGDPDVARHAAAERVMRDGQAAARDVEAHRRHHRQPELALLFDRIAARQRAQRVGLEALRLHLEGARHEIHQEALQLVEQRRDVGGPAAGVILLDQRVVGIELQHLGAALCLLAGQFDHRVERRQEAGPVVARPQFAPELLAAHARPGLTLDELGGKAGQVGVDAAEFS